MKSRVPKCITRYLKCSGILKNIFLYHNIVGASEVDEQSEGLGQIIPAARESLTYFSWPPVHVWKSFRGSCQGGVCQTEGLWGEAQFLKGTP